uniref:Uncharacterized protein n=1 Tax=viral metagenome TaxID=1070528 RepID=A0A6C0CEG1_9ZZZZ
MNYKMNYVRKTMNRSKKTSRSKKTNRSKRNYRKKTNNLKYSRNKNTRKKLGGNRIPFIVALLSHFIKTKANLTGAFPELAGGVTEETLKGIFTTPITEIDGGSGFAIFNVVQYDPAGVGIKTGHIFMVARQKVLPGGRGGNIGSIGFYPKNYRSYFGLLGSAFGETGALVTPDPIAKKYSKDEINYSDFQLLGYDARAISKGYPHAFKILNDTLSKGSINSFKETSMYETDINYQPLAVGKAENCYTYIQNYLGIELDPISSSAIPNFAFGPEAGADAGPSTGLPGMVSGTLSSIANAGSSMLGYGGSRKRLRRKSKNKRNNIKKTRRRRVNKY